MSTPHSLKWAHSSFYPGAAKQHPLPFSLTRRHQSCSQAPQMESSRDYEVTLAPKTRRSMTRVIRMI
jgi:hypothetical protein